MYERIFPLITKHTLDPPNFTGLLQVNWNNPASNGLVFLCPTFGNYARDFGTDLVTGRSRVVTTGTKITPVCGSRGVGITPYSGDCRRQWLNEYDVFGSDNACSFMLVLSREIYYGAAQSGPLMINDGSPGNRIALSLDGYSGLQSRLHIFSDWSDGGQILCPAPACAEGSLFAIVGTYWHNGTNAIRTISENDMLYGFKETSVSDAQNALTDTVDSIVYPWDTQAKETFFLAAVWNRVLDESERRYVSSPQYVFDLVKPLPRHFYFEIGGANLFRSIYDDINTTDTLTKIYTGIRVVTDPIGITDTLIKIGTYIRTEADTVGITDTLSKTGTYIRQITDTIGITDILTAAIYKLVTLADTVGITDALTKIGTYIRSLADPVGITDVLSKIGTFIKSITDNVGITDTISAAVYKLVSLFDDIGITDTLSKIGTYKRTVTESIDITDVFSRIGTYIRSLADSIDITDVLTTSVGKIVSLADTVGITDAISAIVFKLVTLADTVGITDALSKIGTYKRTITELIDIADIRTHVGTYIRQVQNTVVVTSIISRSAGFIRKIVDSVNISDIVDYIKQLLGIVVSPGIIRLTSFVNVVVNFQGYINEKLGLSSDIDTDFGLDSKVKTDFNLTSELELEDIS